MSFLFSKPKIKEVSPAEAQHRLQERTAIIVDVREKREWQGGHIQGARHIPLGDLQKRSQEILSAPDVIFVCASGGRSASAAKAFEKEGHENVSSLEGGMGAWQRAGLPVKR
ncbi:MAG: rhodanese-like domain-containing protein [Chloroflexota bacterium]